MNKPYVLILDEYGYYAPNFYGKRSFAKRVDIQKRWDARCQKRKLNAAVGSEDKTTKTRKI